MVREEMFNDHWSLGSAGAAIFVVLGDVAYIVGGTITLLNGFTDRDLNYDGAFTYSDAVTASSVNFTAPARWIASSAGPEFWQFFEIDPAWPPLWITMLVAIVFYIAITVGASLGLGWIYTTAQIGLTKTNAQLATTRWMPSLSVRHGPGRRRHRCRFPYLRAARQHRPDSLRLPWTFI